MANENHPRAGNSTHPFGCICVQCADWRDTVHHYNTDLANLIMEVQGCMLCDTRSNSIDRRYNTRLRQIIESIQNLRDEIGSWRASTD